MQIKINGNTKITGVYTEAVKYAVKNLERDIEKKFYETDEEGTPISLECGKKDCLEEQYKIAVENGRLVIRAADELGFIYGIYEVSRAILGITEFWFWNDQKIERQQEILLPEHYYYESESYRVRYRGWFVNDEVLISAWSVDKKKEKPWEMVFEALLRLGGNMVIPGTDRNSKIYSGIASRMGLKVTHHHAEPLGAEMFVRVYPDLKPSYAENCEKYQKLWEDAIQRQKGQHVIWNLGFRGQGDYPFWEDNPEYQTEEARGNLVSGLIRKQYDLVKADDPHAVCCTNLYGEIMELYQKGHIRLPEDIIKIWADNGYGKMVSRRQENHNPRVYSLPETADGRHGIYYHVSFYDLQAANHITMLQNTEEFVKKELLHALEAGADDYWIINCSNVKPHVYFLDFIAQMWKTGDIDIEEHREVYVDSYFPDEEQQTAEQIRGCIRKYADAAVAYGEQEDEHAGEQFSNHVARSLISQYMKDETKRAENLEWTGGGATLSEQVRWYQKLCGEGIKHYKKYLDLCEKTVCEIRDENKMLFRDSILLHAQIHQHCYQGAYNITQALLQAMEKDYQHAFYFAGKAREEYLAADMAMHLREHGKWQGFYRNECLTDVKQTAWVLEGLMAYIRNLGDGPHYFHWQREFLYTEADRKVMLILNFENHLKDLELFDLMKKEWDS